MNKQKTNSLFVILFCAISLMAIFSSIYIPKVDAVVVTTKTYYSSTSDSYSGVTDTSYYDARVQASADLVVSNLATNMIGQMYDGLDDDYSIMRSFVYFDTSDLPTGAVITEAVISICVDMNATETDFTVSALGTSLYPHDPTVATDYALSWYGNSIGVSASTSNIVVGEYFNITLNGNGYARVNTDGVSKFVLLSTRDLNYGLPTGSEYFSFRSRESVTGTGPKLIVTYTTEGSTGGDFNYNFYGPYTDSGLLIDGSVRCVVYPVGASPINFTVTSNGTVRGSYSLSLDQAPISVTWNISSSGNNFTRTHYFLTSLNSEDVYLFVPPTDTPFYLYSFTVNDFFGMTNAYLENLLYFDGSNRVVERQRIDAINLLPFYMTWGTTYNMRVVCDNGTLNLGAFTALSDQSPSVVIPYGAFPKPDYYQQVSAQATRLNASAIRITYGDPDNKTQAVTVRVTYWNGTEYISVFSETVSAQSYSTTWNSGLSRVNYMVNVTAVRLGGTLYWYIPCQYVFNNTNPFGPLNTLGSGLPVEMQYLPAVILIACAIIAFSFWHISAGAWIGWGATAFCILVGWLPNNGVPTIAALGITAVICAGITIGEFKKGERII